MLLQVSLLVALCLRWALFYRLIGVCGYAGWLFGFRLPHSLVGLDMGFIDGGFCRFGFGGYCVLIG